MYRTEPYTGTELPHKFLCLTYDDGPGIDTYAIAKFLNEEQVPATFFVVGKYAFHHPDILEKLTALGHLIGNHTYEHPDMPYYLSVNGDVHNQVLRTDAIIRNYVRGNTVYFRSPYGKWSPEVANELNRNILASLNHIGPVHWDIGGVDCVFWKNGKSVDDTLQTYVEEIKNKGRGIVVLHDDIADMDFLKSQNKTLELTKKLIPLLKEQGYTFVRLDEIPSIQKAALQPIRFRLKAACGKLIFLSGTGNRIMYAHAKKNDDFSAFSLEELGNSQIAIKASNGLYFSVKPYDGNVIEAVSEEVKSQETFDLIPFSAYQFALRAHDGNYLSKQSGRGGALSATAAYMRGCERFTFLPDGSNLKIKRSLQEKYHSIRRQFAYIQSKIKQGATA